MANHMQNHKLVDTDSSTTVAGIIGILSLIAVIAWMGDRDRDYEQVTKCPSPGAGQQLIGRGHMESDGHPGELQCTYSTAPVYGRLAVAEQ